MTTALAVPEKGLIDQVFELALAVPSVDESVREEMESLRAARRTLLPVEAVAAAKMDEQISSLASTLRRSTYAEPQLPLEPLGWRWKNGLPKMALLDIGRSATFTITASRKMRSQGGTVSFGIEPNLPSPLEAAYRDVGQLAMSHCIRWGAMHSFSFTFEGVIPAASRLKIAQALQSQRFQGIYMLVETPEKAWKVEHVRGLTRREAAAEFMANLDPLILGWAQDSLWVIDKFDLTTLEQYVADEFAQKALPAGQ